MIVLVTGSRYAKPSEHRRVIRYALLWATGGRDGQFGDHELWEGAAPGVDTIAYEVAKEDFGWKPQRFPADWSECSEVPVPGMNSCTPEHRKTRGAGAATYCPLAGFRRNQLMVDELSKVDGRKVVVGFPIPALGSHGTVDCLTRALHAGLPIVSIPLTSKDVP